MKKILENKNKVLVVVVGLLLLIICVVIVGWGSTYAESISDYVCPLGNYGTGGYISDYPYYTNIEGYYCNLYSVPNGFSSSSYTSGTNLVDETACVNYLKEMGYSLVNVSDGGCKYRPEKISTVTCSAGEYYSGQGKCSTCPANYYCPGGTFNTRDSDREGAYQCPNGGTSPKGSDSLSDCSIITCSAGEYYSGQGNCSTCPVNYYCPGGNFNALDDRAGAYQCPNGSFAPSGSDSLSDCSSITCSAGEYYSGQGQCSRCPANYYCPGGTFSAMDSDREGAYQCPNGTTSVEGSQKVNDCVLSCSAGQYYSGQGQCSRCPANYYCPGGTFSVGDSSRDGAYQCPNGGTSPSGSDSLSDCSVVTCLPGEYYSGQGQCSRCPANYYCPGGNFYAGDPSSDGLNACPNGTTSSEGSTSESDCNGGSNNPSIPNTPDTPVIVTYTVKYHANGGTGNTDDSVHTSDVAKTLTANGFTRVGYTFKGWSLSSDGTVKYSDKQSVINLTTTDGATIDLYAVWEANKYSITYELNNGISSGNPIDATYDNNITIKNPTKVVTIVGNDNKMNANISENVVTYMKFEGWSSIDIDSKTAYYDDNLWDGVVKTKATLFKNLTPVKDGKVTLVANWASQEMMLPIVQKDGYICRWDTKTDGKGTSYYSGGKYVIDSDCPATINLYAICVSNSNLDEEIENGPQTGDVLIYIVWIIGLGALGYSVYYFMKRKNSF